MLETIQAACVESPKDAMNWLALADCKEEQGKQVWYERIFAQRLADGLAQPDVLNEGTAKGIRRAIGHKGRKAISLQVATETVALYGDFWDGGSREEWYCFDLNTGRVSRLQGQSFNSSEMPVFTPTPGKVLIQAGTFCGKKATPRVICHPLDLPELSA